MVWVNVDIDLDELSDDEIEAEYNSRNLGNSWDDNSMLTKIWVHDREGRKDEAYTLMREYVLEKLNKVV
jgi:hypothetical protein